MNPVRLRIDRLAVRMRGVSPRQARERAGALAGEIAQALAARSVRPHSQAAAIPSLSLRLDNASGADSIATQIERQWPEN